MADFDVLVLGGGPAGYAAALKAASRGASVALVEAERPGGACVNHTCIPTAIMLDSATRFLESREMDVMGVFEAGGAFNFGRAAARKETLAKQMADGVRGALRAAKVTLIEGRAAFTGPKSVAIAGDAQRAVSAESIVIATGSRWEAPEIPGISADRIVTADAVHRLAAAPGSALVLGGGPADTAFALEYAVLLAAAGATVTLATPYARLLPAVDESVAGFVAASLGDLGIVVYEGATVSGGEGTAVHVRHAGGDATVEAELVVAADTRRPFFESLNLAAAGVSAGTAVTVGRSCGTNVPGILAAGDVTGGAMLTSAANHAGEVAGENASGGDARTTSKPLPHLLHGVPEIGWVGMTEAAAREAGQDVTTGMVELAYNARAMVLGGRQGLVKVVAERELGEVLGVHVAGPAASEILAVAALAMQAEVSVHDLAATIHWHPSMAEALSDAARRAVGS